MIKRLIQGIMNLMGYQLIRLPCSSPDIHAHVDNFDEIAGKYIDRLMLDPLNPKLHLEYGVEAKNYGQYFLAFAEIKSALFLGAKKETANNYLLQLIDHMPVLHDLNHNQFYRFHSLSSVIKSKSSGPDISILDVGGGNGELASFLPNYQYCLAEPATNGISGTGLPFQDNSFDYVVSCHVLEHIAPEKRNLYLDQLLSKSKSGVILLNPFHLDGTYVRERLQLVIEVTNADWAKEHLECSLPLVTDLEKYALNNNLHFKISPNGTLTTSMAIELMNFFAGRSGMADSAVKINRFFNHKYIDILDSNKYPTAFMVEFDKR